jgi:2-oxoglutarate ferredoxin oxidoreductase subunit gamma
MQTELLVAGFGGQGVMMIGQLMAFAAVAESNFALFYPSYGPAMRGGTANCTVIVGTETIGSPVLSEHKNIIVMNLPSLVKFEKSVEKDGNLIINSSLISQKSTRTDVHSFYIPANEIATSVGANLAANIVILGSFLKLTKFAAYETVEKMIQKKFSNKGEKVVTINLNALKAGFDAV